MNQQDGGMLRKDCVIIRLTSSPNSSTTCDSSDGLGSSARLTVDWKQILPSTNPREVKTLV